MMTLVWDFFDRGGSEKLAMLALADWCDDRGLNLYPSISGIAKKINVSESQARRIVHKFIDEGYLEVIGNHDGGSPSASRRYRMVVSRFAHTPSTDATPSADATPSIGARDPSHGCALPLAPMTPEPPLTINKTTANKNATEFEQFWSAYPKKTGKLDAEKCWKKQKPNLEDVMKALAWQVTSDQWTKNGGQFIPNPAKYLNQGRWQDEQIDPVIKASTEKPWFILPTRIEAEAVKRNLKQGRFENWEQFADRVRSEAGISPEVFISAKKKFEVRV